MTFRPDPIGTPGSMEELIAYVVREHERIGEQGLGAEVGGVREYASDPPRKIENMLIIANGTSFNPTGEGRGIYIWAGNQWNLIKLLPARVITDPVPQEDTSPENTDPTPVFVPPQPPAEEPPVLADLQPSVLAIDEQRPGELTVTISKVWTEPVNVALANSNSLSVSIATQAVVAVGQTTATIPFNALAPGVATITAALQGVSKQATITVNDVVDPDPDPDPPTDPEEPGEPWPLPDDIATAVPTIHCMSLYWQPPSTPPDGVAYVEYKKQSESTWRKGFPLWYDSARNLCLGSIVYLTKGTAYDFRLGIVDGVWTAGVKQSTLPEVADLPLGVVEQVGTRNTPLTAQAGTPNAWRVYENGTIDVGRNSDRCVNLSVPYVIFRNIHFKGATRCCIQLANGAHHFVVSHCEFSEWGSENPGITDNVISSSGSSYNGQTMGYRIGRNGDGCIHGFQLNNIDYVIWEYNKVHDASFGSNPWDVGHPIGPVMIYIDRCTAKQWVIRYNEVYNATSHETPSNATMNYTKYLQDSIIGDNWGNTRSDGQESGCPPNDSDMYGNFIQGVMDDGIEAEGSCVNVRVWNNWIDNISIPIACTQTLRGPIYIFRNVIGRSKHYYKVRVNTGIGTEGSDRDSRAPFGKFASVTQDNINRGGGRRYMFHNTTLQPPPRNIPGETQFTIGMGSGPDGLTSDTSFQPLQNTYARNNIIHIWKDNWPAFNADGGTNNDVDYNLHNGAINLPSPNVVGLNNIRFNHTTNPPSPPVYKSGHGGLVSRSDGIGRFQLEPGQDGHDDGQILNNFNTDFEGAVGAGYYGTGPDRGAHEEGAGDFVYGLNGSGNGAPI